MVYSSLAFDCFSRLHGSTLDFILTLRLCYNQSNIDFDGHMEKLKLHKMLPTYQGKASF